MRLGIIGLLILSLMLVATERASAQSLGEAVQPLAHRYCSLVPGNWRRTAAILSMMESSQLDSLRINVDDMGTLRDCAETVRDLSCSAQYVQILEVLIKEVYHINDLELDRDLLLCGALGAGASLLLEGNRGVMHGLSRGGQAMLLCGMLKAGQEMLEAPICTDRKNKVFAMSRRLNWPRTIRDPNRFAYEAFQLVRASRLTPSEQAVFEAEIEARNKLLMRLPNSLGDR